jgi:hypothetical protein
MNKTAMAEKMTRAFGNMKLGLIKHSPEILVATGIVGVVASTIMACKATTKLSGIVDRAKQEINDIHEAAEHPEVFTEEYTKKDAQKDLIITYARAGLQVAKLYAPAFSVGVLSIVSILASNNMLHKRNVALAAAYTTVNNSFKGYRGRVVERFGEELDKELRYNIKAVEVEEKVVDEKGKEKTVKKTIKVAGPDMPSEYARFFDNGNTGWEDDAEHNLWYLIQLQNWANDKLRCQGHVFLNEVYDSLGIPRTTAGNVVGWLADTKKGGGDGYIDFGIHNVHRESTRDFVNGYEKSILLDFNVDGPIIDLIQ